MENTTKLPALEVYTDGSCIHENNSGSGCGGCAFVVKYWSMENGVPTLMTSEGSRGFKYTTNNRMEIMATIDALRDILDGTSTGRYIGVNEIRMFSDSKYVCDAISQNWIAKWQKNNWRTSNDTSVKNQDLWEILIDVMNKVSNAGMKFTISHVAGHNGNEGNERADQLANEKAKTPEEQESDKVYENYKGKN